MSQNPVTIPELDREQFDAVAHYAGCNGRCWKAKLNRDWQEPDSGLSTILYRLRGTHGPGWLYYFKLDLSQRPQW